MHSPMKCRARNLWGEKKIEGFVGRVLDETGKCMIKHKQWYDIREYGSTLYVGLPRAVSPTNTNFRLTFLLTRLQEALYDDLAV